MQNRVLIIATGKRTAPSIGSLTRRCVLLLAGLLATAFFGHVAHAAGGALVATKTAATPEGTGLIGEWSFQSQQAQPSVVTWNCPAFAQENHTGDRTDVHMKLVLIDKSGSIQCAVVQAADQSHAGHGTDSANVAAVVQGSGVCRFRVYMTPLREPDLMAAGNYNLAVQTAVRTKSW